MSDGLYFIGGIFALLGLICLGAALESWSAKQRRLPPPDARALRSRCDY